MHRLGVRPRRGKAPGTKAALARAHTHTLLCGYCAGLVDLQSARRAARREGRGELEAADGCVRCGGREWPGRVRSAQLRFAAAVLTGFCNRRKQRG